MKSKILLGLSLALFIWACTGKSNKEGSTQQETVKKEQYMVEGQKLYMKYCSTCHQKEGTGLGELYPPVAKSDYVDNNLESVICIMKNGISGPLEVNGVVYNQPMPGVMGITSLEIAEIATYMYNSWGREGDMISVKKVDELLKSCK